MPWIGDGKLALCHERSRNWSPALCCCLVRTEKPWDKPARAIAMASVLIVGFSHLHALIRAYEDRKHRSLENDFKMTWLDRMAAIRQAMKTENGRC